MASKSPDIHWKTADWKASGQLKTLEKEQADLLKSFSRHLNEIEGYLTQNKTMTAEGAYWGFFETYDNLEDNRQQQRLLLKPKYFESFDNDTKRMLEEKRKVLRWVVDKIPDLRVFDNCRAVVLDYRKDTLRLYKILGDYIPIENEFSELEKKPERRRVSVATRWLCETLWIQAWTNQWDLHWQRRSCEISESQNGTWRAKPASREVSASILRWCFRDRKQGRRCWRHFKSARKAIRQQEITFETEKSCQNSKMVKNEKFYKLGPKICTPPPTDFGKAKPEQPEVMADG